MSIPRQCCLLLLYNAHSQELGIPTANVDADALRSLLAEAVSGIYAGWASVGDSPTVYKTVMSIGWVPRTLLLTAVYAVKCVDTGHLRTHDHLWLLMVLYCAAHVSSDLPDYSCHMRKATTSRIRGLCNPAAGGTLSSTTLKRAVNPGFYTSSTR